uniref:Uncharacterized protein n=1 Tax=Meloidogyne enterolobii TaxID=390850 RepID=A0A6V7UNC5_MELEN|nr:unnamed protein product [Meloidogyne enterolobii]
MIFNPNISKQRKGHMVGYIWVEILFVHSAIVISKRLYWPEQVITPSKLDPIISFFVYQNSKKQYHLFLFFN